MIWIIITIAILLALSQPLMYLYKKTDYAKKLREKRQSKLPYIKIKNHLVEKIANAEKYNDWKNAQKLRKEYLWLETIYEFEFHKRKKEGQQEIDKDNIISKFSKEDGVAPEIFNLDNPLHVLYTENVGTAFEQSFAKANKTDLGFFQALNPISANTPEKKEEVLPFKESALPYPKDFIDKALSFLYVYNKEYPKFEYGLPADYFAELKEKLQKFK